MHFNWDDDTIRWYTSASDYTGFYRKVAEAIRPMLDEKDSLCDLGCGLALFDFEIAPYVKAIDCFDVSAPALACVNERLRAFGVRNVKTHLRDCKNLSGKWDVAYMSFFGSRKPDHYLPICRKLIAVVNVASEAVLFPPAYQRHRKNTVDETVRYLDRNRIPHRLTVHELEFGQPFASLEDARLFVRAYSPGIPNREADVFLSKRLTQTGRCDYPFYMPRTKAVGIFELDGRL
jgi:SAM-dependent methyltransferase